MKIISCETVLILYGGEILDGLSERLSLSLSLSVLMPAMLNADK
jgi:cation transporter-like permease